MDIFGLFQEAPKPDKFAELNPIIPEEEFGEFQEAEESPQAVGFVISKTNRPNRFKVTLSEPAPTIQKAIPNSYSNDTFLITKGDLDPLITYAISTHKTLTVTGPSGPITLPGKFVIVKAELEEGEEEDPNILAQGRYYPNLTGGRKRKSSQQRKRKTRKSKKLFRRFSKKLTKRS
jgi:hypothetical protein